MGRVSRAAMVVWPVLWLAGCASIAGLDGITEEGCAPHCGADGGATSEGGGVDAAPGDSAPAPDSSAPVDSAADSSTVDSSNGRDGSTRDAPADRVVDAPVEGGGDGGCATGFLHNYDLDLANATFCDGVANGTFNKTLAMDACAAYTGDITQCDDGYTFGCTGPDGGSVAQTVCANGPKVALCACWGYSGISKGIMVVGPGSFTANMQNCQCPQGSDPKWN